MLKYGGRYQSLLILPAVHATCVAVDIPGNGERNFSSFSTTYSLPKLCMSYTSAEVNWTATQLPTSDCRVPSFTRKEIKNGAELCTLEH